MDFTFGVIAYNQEKIIIETLESIKYQIENYGNNSNCKIIIIDDDSSDGTVELIQLWLNKNCKFFQSVSFIQNITNKGIVYSFNKILKLIKNESFKIVAGDDLIGVNDLFKEYQNLDDHVLITYARIYLKNGKVYSDRKTLAKYFYNMKHNKNKKFNLTSLRKGCYFHTPSTLFAKSLYISADCEQLNSKFRLYEDDPTWYSMIKNTDNLKIKFKDKGIVLYRIHDKSISNGNCSNSSSIEFKQEADRLHKIYYKDTKGIEHIYWWLKNNKIIPKYLNIVKYVDKIKDIFIYMIVVKRKDFKNFERVIQNQINEEQIYYNEVLSKSREYYI